MMSTNPVLTEVFCYKKMFKWTIHNFNKLDETNMIEESPNRFHTYHVIRSPEMTAIDPFDGKRYTGKFELKFRSVRGNFYFESNILPAYIQCNYDVHRYYYCINDNHDEISYIPRTDIPWNGDIEKLTIFVDVSGVRSIEVSPFKRVILKSRENRFKELWKNDSSLKFTIKCGEISIETYKPFLASSSFFFKDMFESGMTQSFLEISDFGAEAVEKMVEFCETGDIKDSKGYEDQLFKIAHKLQISDLMDFTVEKMSENADTSNIFGYLQLATDYKLKDFEEWCRQFAFRAKVNVQ